LSTLRQLAVSLDGMKDRKKAAAVYLTLYEETQIHDTPGRGNPFAFYKNEALAYLNRHSRTSVPKTSGQAGDGKDDTATEKLNVLRRTTSMDISLRWLYFENEGTTADERETGGGEYRFSKLRELYESSDEKTKFYKEVKQNPALPGAEVTHMRIISGHIEGKNIAVALKPLGTGTTGQTLYFGFMPAPDFIRSDILATAAGELLKKNDSIIDFSNPVPANKAIRGKTKLLTVPFQSVPEGRALSLYSDNADFFETLVRKEIRLYYLLLSALVLVLVSGGFLFYKYLARESQLMRMKAEFVDGASHTLKTPLTRISLMAENVKRGWVTDEAKKEEFFNTIISETARMSEMIDNMLNFSRIEAGKQFYEPGKVYLQEIAGELLEHIAGDARERGFQFSVEMDENLPALQLDGKAVKLVVSNLLENALKYSLKEKDISFRLFKEKGFVVLEIRDRGMGIPKKEIPHIFKKFYRVPDAGIKALEGSGLGLFLVSHAVEAQQGKITVNSEEGKGSTFTVCFPMDKNASKPGVKK
ncbi:MAG: HAMP domain-containing histidine kinase, partial [bacterium]|nr:HAMP domain-containing histidine kinase [bacterium]